MSSFKFIKTHKNLSNSNSNVQMPYDNDSKSKNIDSFNGAPAQPAQSFNFLEPKMNQTQQKKGFGFIKKRPNNPNTNTNNLEQSNASTNSNGVESNTLNDLDSLINNTNDLLNFGNVQKQNDNLNNNNNININALGEAAFHNLGNIEEDNSKNQKYEAPFNNNLNFMPPDYSSLKNNNNNYEEKEKEVEKPKDKKSGFSFLNKKGNKKNTNINNSNESDSNKNIPYIANKTPLSNSMSDKLSDKGGNQTTNPGYMNINQAAAETEKDLMNNDEYYMDMNSLNNSNSNNNTNTYEENNNYNNNYNKITDIPKPKKEEEIKEKEKIKRKKQKN